MKFTLSSVAPHSRALFVAAILLIATFAHAELGDRYLQYSGSSISQTRFSSGSTYMIEPYSHGLNAASPTNWALDIKLDSGATSTVVTILPCYGSTRDTLQYQDVSGLAYVCNTSFAALQSWADGLHCNVPAYVATELGYVITVSATCKLTIVEHQGR